MARFLLPLLLLTSTPAFAWDYSTSPCVPPADINAYEGSADYRSPESGVNSAIEHEIKRSVTGELAIPMQNYSNAAPSESKLIVGDVQISGDQVSVNGVEIPSPMSTTPPPPCVIELKPAETK